MPWNFSDMYGRQKVVDANVFPVMVPIYDVTLTATQATIDIQNIPQVYAHLQLVVVGRGDAASTGVPTSLRFNNDSATNYDFEIWQIQGNTPAGTDSGASATSIAFGAVSAATSPAGSVGGTNAMIYNYAGTSLHKFMSWNGGEKQNAAANQIFLRLGQGTWRSTTGISRIQVFPNSGNFVAGTRATLYGLGVIAPASPGSVLPVSYSTTLPSSPLDGQEAILVDNVSTPTYQWRFRYNANSANTDKWEFVGGAPIISNVGGSTGLTSTTYADFSTNASVTLPRSGVYLVEFGASFYAGNASVSAFISVKLGSAAAADANSITSANLGDNGVTTGYRKVVATGMTAGDVVKTQGRASAGTINVNQNLQIAVTPVRVS